MKSKLETITVALAGNPNSGKTTLFNAIVGTHLKVGNWSGVTIEKYEGYVKYKGYKIMLVDLPGTYSLTAYTPEEIIARDYIIEEKPDVVINVVDGTNLERNLYLTTQLMELEPDMLIAMNMYDEVEKNRIKIQIKQLQTLLGSHIIPANSTKKKGKNSLLDHVIRVYEGNITVKKNKLSFDPGVEEYLDRISELLERDEELTSRYPSRWLAIKLLENDQEVYKKVKERAVWIRVEKEVIEAMTKLEEESEETCATRIAQDRYAFVRGAVRETVAYPPDAKKSITDKIDSVVINRFLGLPIFLGVMWMIFQLTFTLGEAPMEWIEKGFELLGVYFSSVLPDGIAKSLIVDGVIAGVGGVVVFIPNILLLFLALSFMEATGYMARAAFVVDKVFHKMGLHGKSFIPMVTGFGCSVPAFMACRTLKNRGDRLATMMVIPFMSCGAKLPVHILLIGAFIPEKMAGNALFGIYLFGIIVAALSAKLFKSSIFKGESEPFVMELPVYRLPTVKSVLVQMWIKAWMYMKKAGTIILVASVIIWLAVNYPHSQDISSQYESKIESVKADISLEDSVREVYIVKLEDMEMAEQMEFSFAGRTGKIIEPVIRPLGFDWKIGVALIAGLAAKEIVVSTMGTIFALGDISKDDTTLPQKLKAESGYSLPMALALMVFVLLYVPCIAATTVFHKEAGAWKWTWFYIGYSMTSAWVLSFLVYNISRLFLL